MILLNKLAQLLGKLTLGKELTMALTLLKLISDALKKHQTDNLARFVFQRFPKSWKAPNGPATEAEFVELIHAGHILLEKMKATLKVS